MNQKITWRGVADDTVEHCIINYSGEKISIRSQITGIVEAEKIEVNYNMLLDNRWRVKGFQLDAIVGARRSHYQYITNGVGQWYDKEAKQQFSGCYDMDITFTPLTNTLPINRLDWANQPSQQIKVLYVDVMEGQIRIDDQTYTKVNDTLFKFQNDGGRFTALIETDKSGLVTNYPELFVRVDD
jgi:hypothetical protein